MIRDPVDANSATKPLRDLAALLGADLSLEQRAVAVITKAGRYRPAPLDRSTGSAERRALRRLADAGLPLPGRRQLRRILSADAVAILSTH